MTTSEHIQLFEQLIAPLSKQQFLSEFWGKSVAFIRGERDRFRELVTWDELNTVLEQHRLLRPRIRMFRDGEAVDAKQFMKDRSRLNAAGLTTALADGATLIVDSVHEMMPAVGKLAEACQQVLQSETTVNLYASWRSQKGFKLHWDAQDTMIVQVYGRKNWIVHGPTRLHPFKDETEVAPEPSDAPAWDDVLEPGDVLYLPRGWWHVAYPLNEPSLHLTVTIVPANGIDLLGWLTKQLNKYPEVRMNVPSLASEEEQREYVARFAELISQFSAYEMFGRFTAEWEASLPVAPVFSLPEGPDAKLSAESLVRLSLTQGVVLEECPASIVPALKKLSGWKFVPVSELIDALPDREAEAELLNFLSTLAQNGRLLVRAD